MPDFDDYLMRHGENGVQSVLEMIERVEGLRVAPTMPLEERWKTLMNAGSGMSTRKAA